MKQEQVNHPKHYNQHPAGIECIDIIRHYVCDIAMAIKYLWRAGLKPEMGKEDAEKEIEDLNKALWYIEDYTKNYKPDDESIMAPIMSMTLQKDEKHEIMPGLYKSTTDHWIKEQTGYEIADIIKPYSSAVAVAMGCLLHVGLIYEHHELTPDDYKEWLDTATEIIQHRILEIDRALLNKEIDKVESVLKGEAIEGEDYVSKPGCNRETEPERYDPLNMIVAFGRVYSLTNKIRKRDNGSLHTPCENCDLYDVCYEDFQNRDKSQELQCFQLCRLHQAETDEYYEEVGIAKYSPSFGTVEVVDEHKKAELELKQLKELEEEKNHLIKNHE